jgi:hypothetical protein
MKQIVVQYLSMTPRFAIIEARAHFCGQMARALRHEHKAAVMGLHAHCHRELRARFDRSDWTRAWMVDGRLAALGGVCGSLLSPTGYVWLAFSESALRHPVAIVRETKRQLDEIMITKRELLTLILHEDARSMRFAEFLGFEPVKWIEGGMLMRYPREARPGRLM